MLVLLTITSMLLALVMSVVAWRATREERRRSDARIAALAGEIHESLDLDLGPPTSVADVAVNASDSREQPMFAPAPSRATAGRWGIALAAGGLVVATVAAAAIVFSGESPTAPGTPAARPPAAVAQASAAPLELVALAHERDGSSLTIRGVV